MLAYAKLHCTRALKATDKSGLPFAGPVSELECIAVWKQREFWTVEEYDRQIEICQKGIDRDIQKRDLFIAERVAKYGR